MKYETKTPPRIFALTAALLLVAQWTVPAFADPAPRLLSLSLEELGSIKIDTVYAASKFTEKVTDAPSSVSIVTREEIQRFGYRTLGEIVRSVRSFDVTYDREYSYTTARGYNRLTITARARCCSSMGIG